MSTFDEELEGVLDLHGLYHKYDAPKSDRDQFKSDLIALIKKHQPKKINWRPDMTYSYEETITYNHALEDSDKAYGIKR